MTKVISISNEVYGKLSEIKGNFSFSQLILKLIEENRKVNLSNFSGLISKEEGEKWIKDIQENRKKQKTRGVDF